jgi:hypothetical protein
VADSVDVEITMGFDASDLDRILTDTEAQVMQDHRKKMVQHIRKNWVGWQYKNVPTDQRGRSGAAWRGYEQTTEGIREIIIENKARSYREDKPYAGYVKRAGAHRVEWEIVRQKLLQSHLPALIEDLESSIDRSLDTPGPAKKVRRNKTSTTTRLSLED